MPHQRQSDRVSAPVPIRFRALGGADKAWLEGTALDLSASGMRFTTPHPLCQGALVEFHILLPDHVEPCMLTGQVLWVGASKDARAAYGAFFTHMTDKQQQMLDELVQSLKRGGSSS